MKYMPFLKESNSKPKHKMIKKNIEIEKELTKEIENEKNLNKILDVRR
jgi:hypothetical protein